MKTTDTIYIRDIYVVCPECGAHVGDFVQWPVGEEVTCPECGKTFLVCKPSYVEDDLYPPEQNGEDMKDGQRGKTMSFDEFQDRLIIGFCAAWCAKHYESACVMGEHSKLGNPPIEDAKDMADHAWLAYKEFVGEDQAQAEEIRRIKIALAGILLDRTADLQPHHFNAIRAFLGYPSGQELKAMVQAGRTDKE